MKALQDYQRQRSDAVEMMCIVHNLDGSAPVPHALVAKFLDAASSRNDGVYASFSLQADDHRISACLSASGDLALVLVLMFV